MLMPSRLKFDLNTLANEMLDSFDQSLFESKTTTFLDPAMGGGQFLKAIEDRLRLYGHSDKNIAKRVTGYAENHLYMGWSRKYRGIISHMEVKDIKEENEYMKFDVALTNPPYQSGNVGEERNIGAPLWPIFIKKTMECLKSDGVAAFVTPATWMNRSKQGAWKTVKEYNLTDVDPNAGRHFPSVDIPNGITWFTLENRPYQGKTSISKSMTIDFHNDELPKNMKEIDEDKLEDYKRLMSRRLSLEVFSGPLNPSINSDHWSVEKTKTHKFLTYYSGKEDRSSLWCDNQIGHEGQWKLVVPNAGAFYKRMEITKKGVGRQGNYILGKKKELERIKEMLLLEDSKKLCELNMLGRFNNALEYVVEAQ